MNQQMPAKEYIDLMRPQIEGTLPKHINANRFVSDAKVLIADPKRKLGGIPNAAIGIEIMKAASLGLYIDGKESTLAAFGAGCQLMPMVAGLSKLARNSGEISSIVTGVVYEKDSFRFWTDDTGEHVEHEPDIFATDRGERKGAFAMAVLKDGSRMAEVLNVTQINALKKLSRGGASGPWNGDFSDEMWRKSPFRRLFKRLPSSTDLDLAFKVDDEIVDLDQAIPLAGDDTPPKDPKQSQGINKLVDKAKTKPAAPAPKQQAKEEQPTEETQQDEPPPIPDDQIPW